MQTVNYNTYALGREGYFSLDLVTGSDTITSDKRVARDLLASLQFSEGKRYADFNESTDKVAAYGIAALVGAVAVKKLGLLALIGVFLLKIWKIALIVALGGFAAIKRFFGCLFGRKQPEADAEYAAYTADDPEPEVAQSAASPDEDAPGAPPKQT